MRSLIRRLRLRWIYRGSETVSLGGQPFRVTKRYGTLIRIETWQRVGSDPTSAWVHFVWMRDA